MNFDKGTKHVMNTYGRFPLVLEKGEGCYVYDEDGKKYVDFVAGIAVNSLGHGHKKLCEAIEKQAGQMIHVSNLYWTKPQMDLAEKLTAHLDFGKAFFCNSGAEAIEGALKMARKYAAKTESGKTDIIAMTHSFHGRTYGAVTATGQTKYQKGLGPLLPGISHVPYNDFAAVENALTATTGAILVEPVQGEGGIHPADKAYLEKLRLLCSEKDILLIFDEVQCGVGRTGCFYAAEYYGVAPDIVVMAKGIAGGIPMGCIVAKDAVAEAFQPGDHASTFGGNLLACAAANVVYDELAGELLDNVKKQGAYLKNELTRMQKSHASIKEVRGVGLMLGIELDVPAGPVIKACMDKGLLLVGAGESVIRFVPPLIVGEKEIDEGLAILAETLK